MRATLDSVVCDLTLSLDTNAYADGDVLADTQELTGVFGKAGGSGGPGGGSGVLQSVVVIDKDDQGEAFDIWVLSSNVTIGTENSAVSVSDANAASLLARVMVESGDYYDAGGVQVANITNNDGLGSVVEVSSGTSLWVACVSRGTGTYTASGIVLRLGFLRDY